MKSEIPLGALLMSLLIPLTACDPPAIETGSTARSELRHEVSSSSAASRGRAGSLSHRAESAFAALDAAPTRAESRVGPQPWPEDLPSRWPVLGEATVVADTTRAEGERLLLLNVPGSPEEAILSYQSALVERGYRVDRPRLLHDRRALHAQSAEHEAVLTFLPHDHVTRVEILFLAGATG